MVFHCLQHTSLEHAGHVGEWLAAHGHTLTVTRLHEFGPGSGTGLEVRAGVEVNAVFPALSAFDALLVLGGPMGAHDEADWPWLAAEKAFVADVVRAGKITLGLGLGAQLLALALGGGVRPLPEPEIGFWTVRFSARSLEHPLLRGWPDKALVLHWHHDVLSVPPGAMRVGMSAGCVTQGFVWGEGIIGLQFKPEMTREMVADLLAAEGHDGPGGHEFVQDAAHIRERLKSVWKGRVLLETLLQNMVALHENGC